MPYAGQIIRAADFPPAQHAQSTSTQPITSDTFAAGLAPAVTTFVTPTSGRISVTIGAGMGVSSGGGRAQVSYQIREGDSSGPVVHGPSTATWVVGTDANVGNAGTYIGRTFFHDESHGLEPGKQYWITTMERLTTPGNGSVYMREVTVAPLP